MAYATDSKSVDRKVVWVRLPPPVLRKSFEQMLDNNDWGVE